MHCVGGQPLVSVLFVAVLITLFFLKNFLLLVVIALPVTVIVSSTFCLHVVFLAK